MKEYTKKQFTPSHVSRRKRVVEAGEENVDGERRAPVYVDMKKIGLNVKQNVDGYVVKA